jgi:hypothetical protein
MQTSHFCHRHRNASSGAESHARWQSSQGALPCARLAGMNLAWTLGKVRKRAELEQILALPRANLVAMVADHGTERGRRCARYESKPPVPGTCRVHFAHAPRGRRGAVNRAVTGDNSGNRGADSTQCLRDSISAMSGRESPPSTQASVGPRARALPNCKCPGRWTYARCALPWTWRSTLELDGVGIRSEEPSQLPRLAEPAGGPIAKPNLLGAPIARPRSPDPVRDTVRRRASRRFANQKPK